MRIRLITDKALTDYPTIEIRTKSWFWFLSFPYGIRRYRKSELDY